MPVRVPFDANWPSTLQSVLPRSVNYTLKWKENEVVVRHEYDGCDDLTDSFFPDRPYDEGAKMDGASA